MVVSPLKLQLVGGPNPTARRERMHLENVIRVGMDSCGPL